MAASSAQAATEAERVAQYTASFKLLDKDNSGHLDLHEVRLLVKSLHTPSAEDVKNVFTSFDSDIDGTVNFDEFLLAITTIKSVQVGENETKQTAVAVLLDDDAKAALRKQFESLDKDSSGHIDSQEVVKIVQDQYAPPQWKLDQMNKEFDQNRDNKVTLDEFLKAMKRVGGDLHSVIKYEAERIARYTKQFDLVDKNKSGTIDYHELRNLVKELYTPTPDELAAVLASFDLNGDKKVSCDEYIKVVTTFKNHEGVTVDEKKAAKKKPTPAQVEYEKTLKKFLTEDFKKLDKDNSGHISLEECRQLARDRYVPEADVIDQVMARFDKDKDGKVTKAEFIDAMAAAAGDIRSFLTNAGGDAEADKDQKDHKDK